MRDEYLDLLKRSLCDLLGPNVLTVVPLGAEGSVRLESTTDVEARTRREIGCDWPYNGVTMAGLRRLDNVQSCIAKIAADQVPGDLIETGVWRGGMSLFMRAALKAYGLADRTVWLADSFAGLPPPDVERYPHDGGDGLAMNLHQFEVLAVSLDEVRENVARYGMLDDGVRFLQGWFSETLPPLRGHHHWSLIRLDGDMYESTIVALDSLYADLSVGGFVVIDDYGALPQCAAAVDDFRRDRGIDDEIMTIDWTGVFWRRSI